MAGLILNGVMEQVISHSQNTEMVKMLISDNLIPKVFKAADRNLKTQIEENLSNDMVNFVHDIIIKTVMKEAIKASIAPKKYSLKPYAKVIKGNCKSPEPIRWKQSPLKGAVIESRKF